MDMGEVSTKQLISVALMLLFAFTAIFFIGYKYAYDEAITYANKQIEANVEGCKIYSGLDKNPNITLSNIGILNSGGENE